MFANDCPGEPLPGVGGGLERVGTAITAPPDRLGKVAGQKAEGADSLVLAHMDELVDEQAGAVS